MKDGEATLRQRIRQPDGSRPAKETSEKVAKLLGLHPLNGDGKLRVNKGALVIPDNFGVALVKPRPVIIPFHNVWSRLQELKAANGVIQGSPASQREAENLPEQIQLW